MKTNTYMTLIDLKKKRNLASNAKFKYIGKWINMIKKMYKDFKTKIEVGKYITEYRN